MGLGSLVVIGFEGWYLALVARSVGFQRNTGGSVFNPKVWLGPIPEFSEAPDVQWRALHLGV